MSEQTWHPTEMRLTVEEQRKLKESLCANPVGLLTELTQLRQENESLRQALVKAKGALHLAKEVTSNGFLPNPNTKRFDMTHFDVHATIDDALSQITTLPGWKEGVE